MSEWVRWPLNFTHSVTYLWWQTHNTTRRCFSNNFFSESPIQTTIPLSVNVSNELHSLLLWEDIPVSTGYRKCTYLFPLSSHVTSFGLSAFSIYLVFPCSSPCHCTTPCSLYDHSPFFSYLPSLSISYIYFICLQSSLPFNTPFLACTNLFLTVALLCFCLSAIHLLSSIPKFLPQIDSLSVVHLSVLILPMCLPLSFLIGLPLLIFSLMPLCNSSVFFLWDYEGVLYWVE